MTSRIVAKGTPFWRVAVHDSSAASPTDPGHPGFLSKEYQGGGRWDAPLERDGSGAELRRFTSCYVGESDEAAVAETFQSLEHWRAEMFHHKLAGTTERSLSKLRANRDLNILDLDDAQSLADIGQKPSTIVKRYRADTQAIALRAYSDPKSNYDGVRWWSAVHPDYFVVVMWDRVTGENPIGEQSLLSIEETVVLTLDHGALRSAASRLGRSILL